MEKSATKRIGINTIYLFLRKLVTLFLAFYTSRLLLEKLGVDDFGLYGLVGSVVAMFGALRGLFSSSIQRFINLAKGKNDFEKANRIFSIGLKIHAWIAIGFTVIVEIGGLIMLPSLNIPDGSYNEAMWILQFSILTSVVSILTVPYDALIIANEKFNTYALLSIVESILKLLIVVALALCQTHKVVYYAGLLFGVSLLTRLINSIYCHKRFGKEAKFHNIKDPSLIKEMTSFASWQFCGNLGFTLTNSGVNIVINLFGGVVVNAARTIAYQIKNAGSQFIGDINVSFRPRSIMQFSVGDMKGFWHLFYLNSKANYSMSVMIAFPIILSAKNILNIWLGKVPLYSVGFLQWIMIYMVIRSLHEPIDLLFMAKGDLKRYQLTELFFMSLNIPISWLVLKLGAPFWSVFAVMNTLEVFNLVAIILLANKQIGLNIKQYFKNIIVRCLIIVFIFGSLFIFFYKYIRNDISLLSTLIIIANSIFLAIVIQYFIIFTKSERYKIYKMLRMRKTVE